MAKAVGLDIGTRSVKVLELEGSGRKVRVTRLLIQDIAPREDGSVEDEALAESVRTLFREGRFPKEQVVASYPTRETILRELVIPFTNDDQIRKVLKFEVEGLIEQHSLDDLIVEHLKIGKIETGETDAAAKSRVIAFAVQKTVLGRLLDIAERGGVDPLVVDLDSLGLYGALTLTPLPEQYASLAVIDIGASATNIIVVQNGKLKVVRSLRVGDESLARAIARDLEIPRLEAEKKKILMLAPPGEEGEDLVASLHLDPPVETGADKPEIEKSPDELEEGLVLEKREEFAEKIGREIARTLAPVKFESPLEIVLVTGGASRLNGLSEALQTRLGVPVETFDPLQHIPHPLPPEQARSVGIRSAAAIGLAAKLLGHDPVENDFRQEEYRYQKRFDQVKVVLACCVSLMVVLFSITSLHFWEKRNLRRAEYERVVDWVWNVEKNAVSDARLPSRPLLEQIRAMDATIQREINEIKQKFGKGGDFPPIVSALEILVMFFRTLDENSEGLEGLLVSDIEVKPGVGRDRNPTLSIEGSVPTPGMVDDLCAILRKTFPNVPNPGYNPEKDGRYEFNKLTIEIPPDLVSGGKKAQP